MIRAFFAIILALSTSTCAAPFSDDEEIARGELLSLAPTGSDAREAKAKLEDKGFECRWNENRSFSGLEEKHDYLYCDKVVLVGPLVTRRWQLALIHESYVVEDAKFGIDLTGP